MKLLKRKFLLTGTAALMMFSLSLAPVNLTKDSNGIQLVTSKAEASSWIYVDTKKRSTKANDILAKGGIAALGSLLAIPLPYTAPLSAFATVIISENMKTAYFIDKRSMRMAGHVFQVKHEIQMYSDSSYKKKKGKPITIIHNDIGGPK
ncbi:hypothetical protein CSV75_14890 [Sporosarcina sp. P18a]|uniref:hypothetical protein n=1 Tax=unclassified Sporosarcina TaxID=2647733 RepID=UPI000C163876|nr:MULTISPECIES: hypothetical protein [unclassified Sporosarcina]PIC69492.1 hypothetical protein CSV77_13205 [Sporosarcina sp. P16b]PIC78769.1 hypothetical protein CSV75_14890 [Sporosarcina sp. P18a]PID02985.1 hypothetical protein CSV67_05825 [Sporosarcina sp. P2]